MAQDHIERDDGLAGLTAGRVDGISEAAEFEARLALVAHELRSPLAVVSSAADTLTALVRHGTPDMVEVVRVAGVVQRHSMLAAGLVTRLGMARRIRVETVDIVALAHDLVGDVGRFLLPSRQVTVIGLGPVRVAADASAVSEILFNLLGNAAKYSSVGAPIDVAITVDGDTAQVVVRNHGSGVAPADIDRVFEQYTQADPTVDGSGLGLFVSRSLARAQGGELSARAAAQEGSEFVLELPALVA